MGSPYDYVMAPGELLDDKLVQLDDDSGTTIIRGGTVLDGTGGRHEDATVVIRGGLVEALHLAGKAPPPPDDARLIDATGATVMPGIMDAHIHMQGNASPDPLRGHLEPSDDVKFIRAAFEMYQVLASGVTTVRALGHGPAEHTYALRESARLGLIHGPRMLISGWALSQTRGHGDLRVMPYDWVEHERPRAAFCDGELECRKMVRRNFGEGADVIKVYSSDNRTGRPDFTIDELSAIADEAHRRGKRVATHAKTYEGVRNALEAGIDTIEHGTPEVHEDLLETMLAQETHLIPTMATVHRIAAEGADWGAPPAAIERAKRELEGRQGMVRRAHEMGVKVGTGSDAGARSGFGLLAAREVALLVDCGFSPMDAVSAATHVAAGALGIQADVGSISAGKAADILVIDGDLLADVGRLQDRTNIRVIVQRHHHE